jgi:hypothetical protein
VLHDQKANQDRTLVFGKSPEKDKYYARDASRPAIFILATEIIDKARRPIFDWRDKTIVKFGEGGTSVIDQIDILRGAEKLSLKKSGTDWTAADGAKLQQFKVLDLLATIDSERALAFEDVPKALGRYGLDKPRLEIVLYEKGKEVARMQLGAENTTPAGVFVKGTGSAIQTAKKDLYDKLNVHQTELVEPPPAPAAPSK